MQIDFPSAHAFLLFIIEFCFSVRFLLTSAFFFFFFSSCQFVDDQAARVLSWLPRKLAPQVRIIFSSIENSQQHETLLKRETKPIEIHIAPLDVESRKVRNARFFLKWKMCSIKSFLYFPYINSPLSLIKVKQIQSLHIPRFCPVVWDCRIHWLHLCRGVRPPPLTSVLDMTLNNLMVRFRQCWSFGECGIPLHCHRSQVHSGPEW